MNAIVLITGPTCDDNIDQCSWNSCGANSTCLEQVGGYQCLCPPGRTGEECLDVVDFCDGGGRCLNEGTCISRGDIFSCQCVPGFQGMQDKIATDSWTSTFGRYLLRSHYLWSLDIYLRSVIWLWEQQFCFNRKRDLECNYCLEN